MYSKYARHSTVPAAPIVPEQNWQDQTHQSDALLVQCILAFLDEHGGHIHTGKLNQLYALHPETKEVLGKGQTKAFCDRNWELTFTADETIERSCESRCSCYLLKFIDERGGSIKSQEVERLYEKHPCCNGGRRCFMLMIASIRKMSSHPYLL